MRAAIIREACTTEDTGVSCLRGLRSFFVVSDAEPVEVLRMRVIINHQITDPALCVVDRAKLVPVRQASVDRFIIMSPRRIRCTHPSDMDRLCDEAFLESWSKNHLDSWRIKLCDMHHALRMCLQCDRGLLVKGVTVAMKPVHVHGVGHCLPRIEFMNGMRFFTSHLAPPSAAFDPRHNLVFRLCRMRPQIEASEQQRSIAA